MANWKNIAVNPPIEDCSVVLKRFDGKRTHYCLARYSAADNTVSDLPEYWRGGVQHTFKASDLTGNYYINLNEIK